MAYVGGTRGTDTNALHVPVDQPDRDGTTSTPSTRPSTTTCPRPGTLGLVHPAQSYGESLLKIRYEVGADLRIGLMRLARAMICWRKFLGRSF